MRFSILQIPLDCEADLQFGAYPFPLVVKISEGATELLQGPLGIAQSAGSAAEGGFSNDWKIFFQWLENFGLFFQ